MSAPTQETPLQTPLGVQTLVLYAMPSAGLQALLWLVIFYALKYGSDVLGVAPAIVGGVFALGRVWDAVSDPIVGHWSDRARTRWGRRRPWLLAGAVPLAVGFWAFWLPIFPVGSLGATLWMAAALLLYHTAYTAVSIPHAAWGTEIAPTAQARTRLYAARGVGELAGIFVAIGALHQIENAPTSAPGIAAALGALAATCAGIAALRLREPAQPEGDGGSSPWQAMRDVLANPIARTVLAAVFLADVGTAAMGAVLPFLTEYVMDRPGTSAQFLAAFVLPTCASIPLWVALAGRIGAWRTWQFSCALSACAFGGYLFVDDQTPLAWLLAIGGCVGLGQAAARILPPAVLGDAIERDRARTGENKEGAYFAAFHLVQKIGAAVAVGIAGLVLQWSGIGAGVAPGPRGELGIRFLMCVLPTLAMALSVGLLAWRRPRGQRTERAGAAAPSESWAGSEC
ncbi:MAG: MFS transporter [Myxococcota bacterium]